MTDSPDGPSQEAPEAAPVAMLGRAALVANLRAGLRCAFLLRADVVSTWSQLGILLALSVVSTIFWAWVAAGFATQFNPTALPDALFGVALLLLATCAIAAVARAPAGTLPLLVALVSAGLWLDIFMTAAVLGARAASTSSYGPWLQWIVYVLTVGWWVACVSFVRTGTFSMTWPRRGAAVVIAVGLVGVPLIFAGGEHALWIKPYVEASAGADRPDYSAGGREEVLYAQSRLLERDLAALLPRAPGRPNLYLVSVAGYGHQDVFRREVDAVDALFAERFGTSGRSLRLVNNTRTLLDTPVATRTAIAKSLKRVGELMDPAEDILFLFLTSHGAKDGRFSLDLYPFSFASLTPSELRQMLDDAGIRNRVIVISACYSGTFVAELASEDSLVMTASSPDRNSFGCSNGADFTYFGKAYFDQALRRTDSFSEAFDLAVPLIAEREKKDDFKPSNPQRFAGARIEPALARWRERRDPAPANAAVAPKNEADDPYARFLRAWIRPEFADDYALECRRSAEGASPAASWGRDPSAFGGLGPASTQWSRIDSAWQRYVDALCPSTGIHDIVVRSYGAAYRRTLSDEDMASVMRFLATPAGQRFASAEHAASSELLRGMATRTRAVSERAAGDYQRALTGVARESAAPPEKR